MTDDTLIAIGRLFCKARREGDGTDRGCPVAVFGKDLAPEPICEWCREDAEDAKKIAAPSAPTEAIERVVRDAVSFLKEFDRPQGDIIAAKVRLAKSLAVLKQVMEKQP